MPSANHFHQVKVGENESLLENFTRLLSKRPW